MDWSTFFLLSILRVLTDNGRFCANEGFLMPLLCKASANIFNRGLLRFSSTYAVNPSAILTYARMA